MNTYELDNILMEASNAKAAGLTLRVDQGQQRRRTFRLVGELCQVYESEHISEIAIYISGYYKGSLKK